MLKALMKKQLLEFAAVWLKDRKTGKMRTGKSLVGMIVLFAFVFVSLGAAFVGMSMLFADSFLPVGLDWLYFAMMGMFAVALGVFGDVFNSFATLYMAKDNELLLSLPVKPSHIIMTRLVSVSLMGLIYESVVFIPAMTVYWIKAQLSPARIIFPVILLFIVAAAVLVLTCILGFFVAQVATRIKGKAFISVVSSILILLVYYVCYFRLNGFLQAVAADPDLVSGKIKTYVYPFYLFGLAGAGDAKALLIVLLGAVVLCALTCFVLSKTFIGLATRTKGSKKTEYKQKTVKSTGVSGALLKRELKRFTSSSVYMMNCGMGLIFQLGITVFSIIKADYLRTSVGMITVQLPGFACLTGAVAALVVCIILSMNQFTAPSVSLEGKYLWILRSLPVETAEILKAKERMHIILNAGPALICFFTLSVVLYADTLSVIGGALFVCAFILFTAEAGLFSDLKNPMLVWTNENVPVKQNTAILITIFSSIGIAVAFAAVCWFGSEIMPTGAVCLIGAALLFAAALFLRNRVYTKGVKLFEGL